MDPFQALSELPKMIAEYRQATQRLVESDRDLAALKEDKLVTWDWVCEYFGLSRTAARIMLKDERVFCYGSKVKRFKKSDIIRFAERHMIKVKDLPS